MGKGNRVLFWKDKWRGNVPFESSFPTLFRLSSVHYAVIADIVSRNGSNELNWNFGFEGD